MPPLLPGPTWTRYPYHTTPAITMMARSSVMFSMHMTPGGHLEDMTLVHNAHYLSAQPEAAKLLHKLVYAMPALFQALKHAARLLDHWLKLPQIVHEGLLLRG